LRVSQDPFLVPEKPAPHTYRDFQL